MESMEKLHLIRQELQGQFLERQDVIDGALVALLTSQHMLVIGPPGTAKSQLADELCRRITGASYFQWLLTKFTTPEELFGAVSLKGLEVDDYRRVTEYKLPDANIAFLDEVFKASSSILNSILTIINERRFHNGRSILTVPLLTLFGASNEIPDDDELVALYDRFLLRFTVNYIQEDFRFINMLRPTADSTRTTLTIDELSAAQRQVREVKIPDRVLAVISELRRELGGKDIIASDRRYRQSVQVLKAVAFMDRRDEVIETDLLFLQHVLWQEVGGQGTVCSVIHSLVLGYEDEAQDLLFQARELRDYANASRDDVGQHARAVIEAHTKLRRIVVKVAELEEYAREVGRSVGKVVDIKSQIQNIQTELLENFEP